MKNQLQIFKNEELGLKVRTIKNENGSISINAEDTAIGFGWCKTENKKGKQYNSVRWATINGYCKDLGFDNKLAKDDFIPESLFYMLGMKASNNVAKKFQQWLAIDVIPNIRKHGGYLTNEKIEEVLTDPDTIIKLATQLKEERQARKLIEVKNKVLNEENNALVQDIVKWADESIINAIVRKYGANIRNDFGSAWIEFKKNLLYKYSINLNSRITAYLNETGRKTKPKTLSMLKGKEELTMGLKTAISMCKDEDIDISDILGKHLNNHELDKIVNN